MRIILAETGCDYNIESVENNEEISMATLKETIEEISDISVTDQILITASGIQLKESNNKTWLKDDHHPSKAIVVFNRRLLETDHSADYLIHTTIPRLSKNLMELDLPELKQLEEMIELHEEENRDRELWELLAHVCQTCVDISFHRRTVIEKITREIDAQVIALHAALNNLESHVRTAYQTITKFDRIGQREFSRLAISIGSIDLDIELMRNVEIHPYLKHLLGYDELSLASYISIEGLEMHKHKILRNYDELVSATLDEKNSLNRLNQQAAEFNKNRASSDHLLQRTKKIRSEAYRLTESIQDTQKKMTDGIRRRKKIAELKQRINLTEEETEIKSSWTPDYFRDALKALYMNDAFIHEAEQAILSEKQTSIINLVNTLQSISVVEESLATIYPRLADLERSIKALRFDIERGKGAMARRMIAGYGFLLIESWRRYTYSEIRTKHQIPVDHQLENQEMQYRNTFESELIYLDTLNVFESEDKMEEGQAILPISFKDNLVNSSDDSWIITRKEVEEYIQLVQSFYANNSVHEEKKRRSSITSANEDTIPRDISTLLYSRLDREIKRLGQGVQILDGVLRPEALKVPQFKGMISPSVSSSSSTTRIESSADWEKEKRMLARKTHDYTRRMEDIVLQKDKKISQYENDIQSLLRKNKTTDKRISDVKTEYETIVHYYINTLREKELEYRKKEEEWKQIYDQLVTKEQAKSERRLNEFRERMMAKDIEYARLEAVRQTQSAPTSPVHATFKQYPNQELKKEIEELKLSHQVEIERLKADYEERLVQQDELLSQRNPSFYKKLKQFEVWKERMVAETEKDKALSQKKITDLEMKVKDLKDKMFSHDESMKQLYMKENQQLTMQYEAKIDNLETEHHHTLQEAQDSFENEKDVLRIELQLSRDQEKKEMEDRLGKEQLRYSQLKRSHVRISDQMHQLQKQENTAKQLAKSIVSITSSSPMNSSLLDLLTRALHDIAGIKMKNSVIEQSMETSFNMGYTPFGY